MKFLNKHAFAIVLIVNNIQAMTLLTSLDLHAAWAVINVIMSFVFTIAVLAMYEFKEGSK